LVDRYVFPDIHGCIHTLRYAIEKIIQPSKKDELYFVGDFINKGPDSRGVLDYIIQLRQEGYHINSVRGNHEQMLLNAIEDENMVHNFKLKGGLDTLESFDVHEVGHIPEKYIDFIQDLPFYLELEDCFIVHAGFNFSIEDPFEDLEAMLTIRDFTPVPEILKYKKIIHGHNARTFQEILYHLIEKNEYALNIDNGCVYTHREGMGNLLTLNINDMSYHIQPCLDEHKYEDSINKRRYYRDES
jgi:serine/threonine protein phosphatase 1